MGIPGSPNPGPKWRKCDILALLDAEIAPHRRSKKGTGNLLAGIILL